MIVSNDNQLGAASAPLQFNGGTLVAGAGLATRPTLFNAGGATVQLDGNPLDPNQFLEVTGPVSGAGSLTKIGSGTLIYSGDNSYTGPTTIAGGFLYFDGNSAAQTGTITAESGTRFGGKGTVGGEVVIQNGATLGPGSRPFNAATLTINGNLNLNPNSTLLYNLVEANAAGGALNDLTVVHGNLTLDGQINILDQGQSFGPGVYRIINYDGALTNNGLAVGGLISSTLADEGALTGFSVQTRHHRSSEPDQHDRGDAELLGWRCWSQERWRDQRRQRRLARGAARFDLQLEQSGRRDQRAVG